ncbi:unnamed protein product [Caenorhabditis auriculariae]|uniref:Uncharacterized protein n=1 Tax=Caenorhabditis auriculariae TaxID=2777116 RepID=A0A8S1GUN5_9PELO|nr:unnamed protein product [Caenorhabditis auriculariae]
MIRWLFLFSSALQVSHILNVVTSINNKSEWKGPLQVDMPTGESLPSEGIEGQSVVLTLISRFAYAIIIIVVVLFLLATCGLCIFFFIREQKRAKRTREQRELERSRLLSHTENEEQSFECQLSVKNESSKQDFSSPLEPSMSSDVMVSDKSSATKILA